MSDYNMRLPEYCVNESAAIAGSFCNGCKRLEVVIERRRGRHGFRVREKYYCRDVHHGYFDPRAVDDCGSRLIEGDHGR